MSATSPTRLEIYRVLCSLSPEAYAPLARMIVATAQAESTDRHEKKVSRRNRRFLAGPKPQPDCAR